MRINLVSNDDDNRTNEVDCNVATFKVEGDIVT